MFLIEKFEKQNLTIQARRIENFHIQNSKIIILQMGRFYTMKF